ncbi:MAG: glutamyl-tRNA reductase [Microthrixaceae bacterium]
MLERLSIAPDRLEKYLDDLVARDHVNEAVIVSTCNRTEVVVTAEKFHGAFDELRDFLCDLTFLPPEQLSDHLFVAHDADAVRHLFSVTAGLDSVVVGEHEILGQVRRAWEAAAAHGCVGPELNLLFRHAVEVGKRVRTETSISRSVTSVSHAAAIMAADALGTLTGRSVAVVGAGSMARGVVDFVAEDAARVVIVNRTAERARALAGDDHEFAPLESLTAELAHADVVLSATSAQEWVLTVDQVAEVMNSRAGRPLLVVDIAMPRDVEPAVAMLDGVTLLDMDALGAFVSKGRRSRDAAAPAARRIVEIEVERYLDAAQARRAAPLVAELHARAADLVSSELARRSSLLDAMDDHDAAVVAEIARAVAAKLVHTPTTVLKAEAGTPRGDRLAISARELFDL